MAKAEPELNTFNEPVSIVSIDGETLTGPQAEILYQATTRAMGRIGERVAENRYDIEALAQLSDATRISTLLLRAVPKKPDPKPKKPPVAQDE